MSDHTPRPWDSIETKHGITIYCPEVGWSVASISLDLPSERPMHEANARLIAAAPDLLEALYQCLGSLKALGAEKGYASEAARGAIAKATDQPVQSQTNASIGSA